MNERKWKQIFSKVGLVCAGFAAFSVLAQYSMVFFCVNAGISA